MQQAAQPCSRGHIPADQLPSPHAHARCLETGGKGAPSLLRAPLPSTLARQHLHSFVHGFPMLVLQASLGQVDGEHAGHPHEPCYTSIDEFGCDARTRGGERQRERQVRERMQPGMGRGTDSGEPQPHRCPETRFSLPGPGLVQTGPPHSPGLRHLAATGEVPGAGTCRGFWEEPSSAPMGRHQGTALPRASRARPGVPRQAWSHVCGSHTNWLKVRQNRVCIPTVTSPLWACIPVGLTPGLLRTMETVPGGNAAIVHNKRTGTSHSEGFKSVSPRGDLVPAKSQATVEITCPPPCWVQELWKTRYTKQSCSDSLEPTKLFLSFRRGADCEQNIWRWIYLEVVRVDDSGPFTKEETWDDKENCELNLAVREDEPKQTMLNNNIHMHRSLCVCICRSRGSVYVIWGAGFLLFPRTQLVLQKPGCAITIATVSPGPGPRASSCPRPAHLRSWWAILQGLGIPGHKAADSVG